MRITGGEHKGRKLAPPSGTAIRPTTDRVREAVFNILRHGLSGFSLTGARTLDLFAGTGALGLEAMSRGAGFCLFIDQAGAARALVRENAERLGLTGQIRIWRRDVTHLGRCAPMKPFNLVFADPPYNRQLANRALAGLITGGWLENGAVVVLEEARDSKLTMPDGLLLADTRNYGDTCVAIARYRS